MSDSCKALIVSRTGHPVQHIVLRMPEGFRFRAGQYILAAHPDGPVPLSIASAPRRLPELHLHYLSMPDAPDASRMDELLNAADTLELLGPQGDVALPQRLDAPALIAAGGTGVAQAMSFIDTFAGSPPGATVSLLWCADAADDFYLSAELDALQREHDWLRVDMLADADRSDANRGQQWLRDHAATFADPRSRIVLAGSPGFVYAACDTLAAAGIDAAQMQSDVFSYAPRD